MKQKSVVQRDRRTARSGMAGEMHRPPMPSVAARGFRPDDSVATALSTMTAMFSRAGLDSPALDARILTAHVLGVSRQEFLLASECPVGAAVEALGCAASRRLGREPVARILGFWEFWGLTFELRPSALVPRPDTETVVEIALGQARRSLEGPRILDLGTGCGAILVALLHELPNGFGIGVDRSTDAVVLARANAIRNGVGDRAAFVGGHWAKAVEGGFDIVVSNPPYVSRSVMATLDPEVQIHDPVLALDGGSDGLDAYRSIAVDLPRLLKPCGCAIVEVGAGQSDNVLTLLAAAGLDCDGARRDLGGRERVVLGRMTCR